MAVKSISTRAQICGRGSGCHGGHSAVEESGYIGREKMYSEYDGVTYYPKYKEDLVHNEVMLPENAPEKYRDPSVLWNSVEMNEKSSNAQLARTYRVELPNEWSYELATEVMRDYVRRNFVDPGMCAQFAIHDSENEKTGQRNLHCHIMLTMRSIDDQGHWMSKQRKVYLTDENGDRIPLIDKKTGCQKLDNQNRKQWKCTTVSTNDWSNKEKAKIWRKDLVDTINAVNEKTGMTENFWEHRSFKDQGLEIIPQIHLGEKASAMERAGIRTIRGDINREIIAKNAVINAARAAYEKAKENLEAIKAIPVTVVTNIKNEIIHMIREVAKRNNDRLSLPIMKGRYLGQISDRATLQNKEYMESFVQNAGWTSFEDMMTEKGSLEEQFVSQVDIRTAKADRIAYLEELLGIYEKYESYIKNHKEQWALKGYARKKYERQHIPELAYYDTYRSHLKEKIKEPDKKINPKAWDKELTTLKAEYSKTERQYAQTVWKLAVIEVLSHNRKELDRMLGNESRQTGRTIVTAKKNERSNR